MHPNSAPLSIIDFRGSHCPRRAWMFYEDTKEREKGRWWCYLFTKCFFLTSPSSVLNKGAWRARWGKVIYCSLLADSTGQDAWMPTMLGHFHWWRSSINPRSAEMESGQCMYLYRRSSNRCAQTDRWIDTRSCKQTRYINWNTQPEVSWPFSLLQGLLCTAVFCWCWSLLKWTLKPGSGSGQFRATIYRLTTLQFQLPKGWVVKNERSS